MKKINDTWIVIFGILFFLVSYMFDDSISSFFKKIQLPFLDVILSIITNFGVVIVLMLLIPSFMLYRKDKKLVYLLLLSFVASIILVFIAKLIFLRQRPLDAFAYPFINIINYSFPSMHSAVAFALLPILAKHLSKQRVFWILLAFFVAFSRVYLGFHFLSDVVFGSLFGYFIGDWILELYEKGKLW
ncbi:hypothetical protein CMO83_02400 [Candidatus Woesearchaeota archaeon]|jgi:undecaprenyl-diphosphatase|nr:hypothetical protein [Candidatus Woesearchaeota archaeon]MDP6648290.1 phosphatase PAP2 family protein [Candidatus Woesearchaeota archaeon]|tara:strand:+ start:44299 stop:44859 length:561 start_codon:yes stop_codon:yes gene_type:complete